MHGGQRVYRGSGREALGYLNAGTCCSVDQSRTPYHLRENLGVATMLQVDGRSGAELDRMDLSGDDYLDWVEGKDVRSEGHPAKGRLRHDAGAARFIEFTVNGPKTLALAAGMDPEGVGVAYGRAQDRATAQVLEYVARNVTTRVGAKYAQRNVRVDAIEAAVITHTTSRAGDPHVHRHVLVNARVRSQGGWRGIDTLAMQGIVQAVNGIGGRAIMADPEFRAVLAERGYTLGSDGEIESLRHVVAAMSKRSEQVAANKSKYEKAWRSAHPGREPKPELVRAWDQYAWADGRPDKRLLPTLETEAGWVQELRDLGVDVDAMRAREPVPVGGIRIADVDRAEVADRALKVLGAGARGRSLWNVHDIRGGVEDLLASRGVVAEPWAFRSLAEDISALVCERSVSVLNRYVPDHLRHLTSPEVIALERGIKARLTALGRVPHVPASIPEVEAVRAGRQLDDGQIAAVRAIAGTGRLVLIEGPAGGGKSQLLATAKDVIAAQGRSLMVVASTKKAAIRVQDVLGAGEAITAAGLAVQHGFRFDAQGVWSRLRVGDHDELTGRVYTGPRDSAVLNEGDVLLVDEAGMLDQATTDALLTIVAESGAHAQFMGDRRQLAAVGRGGVLDMVAARTAAHVEMTGVHRFRTADGGRDEAFAELSLRIRSGVNPGEVFDELAAGGHIRLHATQDDAVAAMAADAAGRYIDGVSQTAAVATNELAEAVNSAVRADLVGRGVVDDRVTVTGRDGLRIGRGDLVTTRRNDGDLDVANRELWVVQDVDTDGSVVLRNTDNARDVQVPAAYVTEQVHLGYASTIHGVQGENATHGAGLMTASTDAAALYVAVTRGVMSNTLGVVAETHEQAREQFVEAMNRDRADIGLDAASAALRVEAEGYASTPRPYAELSDRKLDQLVTRMLATQAAADQWRQHQEQGADDVPSGPATRAAEREAERLTQQAAQARAETAARELSKAVTAAAGALRVKEAELAAASGMFAGGKRKAITAEISELRAAHLARVAEHAAAAALAPSTPVRFRGDPSEDAVAQRVEEILQAARLRDAQAARVAERHSEATVEVAERDAGALQDALAEQQYRQEHGVTVEETAEQLGAEQAYAPEMAAAVEIDDGMER